ncbi:hypothetical protein BD779DRAFT_929639 [Infundibulicybe gibba]|nr:hypothetical protein BD779DRAFT_929639 [Infundibulicybe gibba]
MSPSTFAGTWGNVTIGFLVSFPKDSLVLKCAIALIWLCSALRLLSDCWVIHSILISGYDQPFYGVIIPVGLSISIVLGTIVQAIGKGTYIFRMYRFGQNRYILACCCVLILVELGLGLVWAGRVAINDIALQVETREQEIEWVITTQFTISAFIDVFVTASVSYWLRQNRADGLKRTRYLADKIMQWTIQTGILTSAMAIAVVLMWNIKRDSLIWLGLSAIEPECYAFCLLAMLNARRTYSRAIGSDNPSLPMTALWAASGHTGASSGPAIAENATAATVLNLRASPDKEMQIVRLHEFQDRHLNALKSAPHLVPRVG